MNLAKQHPIAHINLIDIWQLIFPFSGIREGMHKHQVFLKCPGQSFHSRFNLRISQSRKVTEVICHQPPLLHSGIVIRHCFLEEGL